MSHNDMNFLVCLCTQDRRAQWSPRTVVLEEMAAPSYYAANEKLRKAALKRGFTRQSISGYIRPAEAEDWENEGDCIYLEFNFAKEDEDIRPTCVG
jgi:hypothetical protein